MYSDEVFLYVHFLYCKSRCPYCDFFKGILPKSFDEKEYVKEIIDNLKFVREFGGNKEKSLTEQFYEMKDVVNKKHIPCKYIGYFQARTNTYADIDILKSKYEEVLSIPDVIGLNIATRCDAISDECLDYLDELNKNTDIERVKNALKTMPKVEEVVETAPVEVEEETSLVDVDNHIDNSYINISICLASLNFSRSRDIIFALRLVTPSMVIPCCLAISACCNPCS